MQSLAGLLARSRRSESFAEIQGLKSQAEGRPASRIRLDANLQP